MELKARLIGIDREYGTTKFSLSTEQSAADLEKMLDKELRVKLVQYRKGRSLNANALFWHCVTQISEVLNLDNETVYLDLLRNYGKSTFICVKPHMVSAVKKQWRESMELGPVEINGKPGVQMQVFFGSSTYDTKEMSRLIDGAIQQMKDLDIEPPIPKDVKTALEAWNAQHNSE